MFRRLAPRPLCAPTAALFARRHCAAKPTEPKAEEPKADAEPKAPEAAKSEKAPYGAAEEATEKAVQQQEGAGAPELSDLEKFSRDSLTREGREHVVDAVVYDENTTSYPILARGRRNVYDHTDDIPQDVKPMYHHQLEQNREYFKYQRELAARPLWKRVGAWVAGASALGVLVGAVMFTRTWLQQPAEVAQLRVKLLENSYGKVLELAAGHGLNVGSYPYPVHEICMVDSNAQQLERLRYRLPKNAYPKYGVYQDRVEHLESFGDGEFDCVVDMFGLCHYRDPVMALRQMQRVVKPTGTILLLEHGRSPYFPVNWLLDYFSDSHTAHTHGCLWNLPILDFIKEARLEVRETENMHYGTTYYVIAHPETLDEKAMAYVPKQHMKVR